MLYSHKDLPDLARRARVQHTPYWARARAGYYAPWPGVQVDYWLGECTCMLFCAALSGLVCTSEDG